jgi:uncharacterized membrane protein
MVKFLSIFKSRKFWAAVIGIALMFLRQIAPNFPIGDEQISDIVLLLVAYIMGVAVEDAGAWISGNKPL